MKRSLVEIAQHHAHPPSMARQLEAAQAENARLAAEVAELRGRVRFPHDRRRHTGLVRCTYAGLAEAFGLPSSVRITRVIDEGHERDGFRFIVEETGLSVLPLVNEGDVLPFVSMEIEDDDGRRTARFA